jgi:hypothetical protein
MFDKRPSRIVWALGATLLVACMNGTGGADVAANEEALRKPQVEWTTFVDPKGTDAAGSTPMARLIRSESGYRRLFGHHSPGVDFEQDVVLFYSAGAKNTGGFGADITGIVKHARALTVTTQLTVPGPDCVVTQALSTPAVLARVHAAGRVRKAVFEHTERVEDCTVVGTPCGGLAGRQCPGSGTCDRDDPTDDCDPEHAADCGMLCSCNIRALCIKGFVFDGSGAVCACVPDPSADPCAAVRCKAGTHCLAEAGSASCVPDDASVFCGGIAGIECPGLGQCDDNAEDECDAEQGGADCGGYCTCSAFPKCKADYIFDRSPQVCACVKPVEDPCALVDCRSGAACIVSDGQPICVSNGNWECGKNVCPAGQQCCNESCGLCAPLDGACIQIACLP